MRWMRAGWFAMVAKIGKVWYISIMKPKKSIQRPRDKTSIQMKKAGIKGGGVNAIIRPGEWELAKINETKTLETVAGKPKGKKKPLQTKEIVSMAHDKAGGMSYPELSDKYGLSEGYIAAALRRLYVSTNIGKQILKGVLLENAIVMGTHARNKIADMTGMQAAVATGIMTSRFVELDKHDQQTPQEIDFKEIAEVGAQLRGLVAAVGGLGDNSDTESVLDIESSSEIIDDN